MPEDRALTLDVVRQAVAGAGAAFRLTLKLDAVSPKVFPPTYEGGRYATEERRIRDDKGEVRTLPCVLLDSVPSQANRMELALQEAWEAGEIELLVISADFTAVGNPGVRKITSLQAPHRIADAILRDSLLGKQKFRQSDVGKALDEVSVGYATPLLQYAPHALVFGMWDSTGPRGGLGVKFARAVVSEIIGVNAVPGVVTSSRIDPLNIRAGTGILYKSEDGWTLDPDEALKKGKEPITLGSTKKKKGDGSPAEANHGNIPPTFSFARDAKKNILRDEKGKPIHRGGFTIDHAEQTTVLSLPALRRLRFPAKSGQKNTSESDAAARTYLAALALLSVTLAVECGYDLRSRCLLRASGSVQWQRLGRPGEPDLAFSLPKSAALALYADALAAARREKLVIEAEEITLIPTEKLLKLVRESLKLAGAETDEED